MDVPNSCPLLNEMRKVRNVLSTEYRVGAVVNESWDGFMDTEIVHLVVLRTKKMTHVYVWND